MDINPVEMIKFLELIKLKKEKPDDYAKLMTGFKEVMKDIIKVCLELGEELNL